MIEKITVEELKQMQEKEGIVFQGCGGELQEWEDGVNELLTESGILLDGDTFKNVYAVSYTHLDVYKRQRTGTAQAFRRPFRRYTKSLYQTRYTSGRKKNHFQRSQQEPNEPFFG